MKSIVVISIIFYLNSSLLGDSVDYMKKPPVLKLKEAKHQGIAYVGTLVGAFILMDKAGYKSNSYVENEYKLKEKKTSSY